MRHGRNPAPVGWEKNMFNPDSDIDLGKIPWQLLIRARYADEIDTIIASTITREVAEHGSRDLALKVARAAFAGVADGGARTELSDSFRLIALNAVADWEDGGICPAGWPWHGPRPHYVDEISDPIVMRVLEQGIALVTKAGSRELHESLLPALRVGSVQREPAMNRA